MKNNDFITESDFDKKFLQNILGLCENEAKETAVMLKRTLSPDVIKKLIFFIEFVSDNKKFTAQFKNYLKIKK